MRSILLFSIFLLSTSFLFAQTELILDPLQTVNGQIEADQAGGSPADVYIAESGNFYVFDATLLVDFDLHIKGESSDWIYNQATPPVFVPLPDGAGDLSTLIQVTEGGSLTFENVLCGGRNSVPGGEILGGFINETGATKLIIDNCVFSDMNGNAVTTNSDPELVSITNCIMINSFRTTASPWGGHLGRFNTLGAELVIENNTFVNSGRLLGNGGHFYNTNITFNHNTSLNAQTNAVELHYNQALYANNIYYNWSWMGRRPSDVAYNYSITTFETFSGLELDSVSCYFGKNLLYRDPAIKEYYDTVLDTLEVSPYITWNSAVDSTVLADDNFTLGKDYWDIDPAFTTGPGNLEKMLEWLSHKWAGVGDWPDWRITSPVTYDGSGQPVLNWPPAFDLSYSNIALQGGGTDDLPVGDLNWYPAAKADYMANRDNYIAALEDSITNATSLYIPGDPESQIINSIEVLDLPTPNKFYLAHNYPNPFNPTTTVNFGLPEQSKVTFTVYTILGQKVFELKENRLSAGVHAVNFDASELSSGIYVYQVKAVGASGRSYNSYKKMTLIK